MKPERDIINYHMCHNPKSSIIADKKELMSLKVSLYVRPASTLKDMCLLLVKDLKIGQSITPKIVVFFRSLKTMLKFILLLLNTWTGTSQSPLDCQTFYLFDWSIFTVASTAVMREEIIQEFVSQTLH